MKPIVILLFAACFLTGMQVLAQDTWPKEIAYTGGGSVTIYQPQPEKLSGNVLNARAAVSIRKNKSDEPVFGVMWFQGELIDGRNNLSTLRNITVKQCKFGDEENISGDNFKKVVEKGLADSNIQFSRESLLASIKQEQEEENFSNDPPLIIYRDKPTTLIVLDGEPMEQQDEDLLITRIVNTPYLIVKNPDDKKYYLYGGSFWYSSSRIKDGWINVKKLPSRIKMIDTKMKEEEKKAYTEKNEADKFTTPTDILVVTEPAELIQTEGKPSYQSIQGSTLLYINNSLDEIFKDIDSQKNYILIAGRWYRSVSLNGPWEYVSQDKLPPAFADIPAGSEKDGVLASVAGTLEANDAVMEAQIPQTAKVDRSTARVDVNYDGEPKFAQIKNTNLSVAENSNITVMRAANNRFYALENGIWFVGNGVYGPWEVANERPSDVDRIPPSNSAYNAKYVHIYETTPQYVYVGYTQGYMGNYINGPTVVWGTGYRYRSWRGTYYRPRPVTWGFGMQYNPWAGWSMSFGLGFNVGWYHYGYARPHYYGGWFGPPAYRPALSPWSWNGGYYGNRQGNGRPSYGNGPRPNVVTNRPVNNIRPNYFNNNNLYRNRKYVVATRDNVYKPVPRPNREGRSTGANKRPSVTRPGSGSKNGRSNVERPATGSGQVARPDRTRPLPGTGQTTRPAVTRPQVVRPFTTPGENTRPTVPSNQNRRPDTERPNTGSGQITPTDRARPATGRGQTRNPSVPSNHNNRTRPTVNQNQNSLPARSRPTVAPVRPETQSSQPLKRESGRGERGN